MLLPTPPLWVWRDTFATFTTGTGRSFTRDRPRIAHLFPHYIHYPVGVPDTHTVKLRKGCLACMIIDLAPRGTQRSHKLAALRRSDTRTLLFTMIGWYASQGNAKLPEGAKDASARRRRSRGVALECCCRTVELQAPGRITRALSDGCIKLRPHHNDPHM